MGLFTQGLLHVHTPGCSDARLDRCTLSSQNGGEKQQRKRTQLTKEVERVEEGAPPPAPPGRSY